MARQLRLRMSGCNLSCDEPRGAAAVFENAGGGRSAENGIGGEAAKTDGDNDGLDCQGTQRWRAESCLERGKGGHGRLGRVETGPLARTIPIRTVVSTALHRRDAHAPLQKSKRYRLLVLFVSERPLDVGVLLGC